MPLAVGAALAGWLIPGGSRTSQPIGSTPPPRGPQLKTRAQRIGPARLVLAHSARLSQPLQDGAAAAISGTRALLLGGLSAADTSTDGVLLLSRTGATSIGRLPVALHDSAAVQLGRFVYLLGGGTATNQLDQIVRVAGAGQVSVVGRLPAPSSDQAAAAVGGTAYIVGGYTGSRWLDTIVAWRPGTFAHVVAHLPFALRYAAVAAAGRNVVIAGGSRPNGTASDAVFEFAPANGRLRRIGTLPAPVTHAAAAALGQTVFAIGGRGAAVGTPTDRIVAVDLPSGRIRPTGRLPAPLSDLTAVTVGGRILVAGGRGSSGTASTVTELVARAAVSTPARSQRAGSSRTVNVYAADGAGNLTGAARRARPLVYVPNSQSATVHVIDPRTYRIVEHFPVGLLPQHVVPSYDLKTLYVTNDLGNSLTPIDPRTGKPGTPIPVDDPYNMYFTPDGRYAIVVAERLHRLDFRDPHSFRLRHSLVVPCVGVDHMDFSADGSYLLASCEFSGQLVKVDVARQRVVGVLDLPDGRGGVPQDVRLSPDGKIFYTADLNDGGVWKIDGSRLKVVGFVATGKGAHGLYPSRDGKYLYVSNRGEGSVSVLSFKTEKVVAKWRIPGGGSPDMGGVSADGRVLWLSGRYNSEVYAIDTRSGRLLARIPVGAGPHGLCFWPQPGRYSLGHTDNMR